ncbi:SOS response-associated peptidase [Leucobacter insecticola]|uniref:SOS response-associated peptidase n=1 Tax=Leucobacter insecticola TaxID=2714934 RepID=A0A6G8FJ02_9MICO|nr:SOS response-associated peptidase family protein [Leucobacter insecticola]QIM16331.1 SOS response-associated peptidase [Leucobacter insecticola]
MCASYGLGGGPLKLGLTFDLPPMHEPESRELLARWAREQAGTAKITGRHARNLNPMIREVQGERSLDLGWWWLHVGGAPAPFSAFNSRADALAQKWREPFQRRAILPANWYIEKGRSFSLPRGEMFGIAAIVTPVETATGQLLSYSMVTREAVGEASEVHHRMPLVLPRDFHDAWLDPGRAGNTELASTAVYSSEQISRAFEVIGDGLAKDSPTLF